MATLVLSTVGTLVGGPLGGALGALVGRTIDQTVLFRPRDREGPRLTDLAVQSSQYGSPFAHVHGRVRIAGTVIWATDLKERRIREGGGKGRPGTTRYSYSVSFAVALLSTSRARLHRTASFVRHADVPGIIGPPVCSLSMRQKRRDTIVTARSLHGLSQPRMSPAC